MKRSPLSWLRSVPGRTVGIGVAGLLLLATLSLCALRVRPSGLYAILASVPTTQARIRHRAPWVFGRPAARFTIIEYADLECPYCRAYFPVLKRWIQGHPQVNWEWWNLPLTMNNPAALREAVLAECIGEADGDEAFWRAVARIYRHTQGDGRGIAAGGRMPGLSSAIRACLANGKAERVIRTQAAEASRQRILATPTLRILDRKTGGSLRLQGPVVADSLLSAMDWLAANGSHNMLSATSR